jgi:RHS repeat-associated protein
VVRLPPKKTRPRKKDGARPGGRHARGNPDSVIPAKAGIQDVGWVLNPHGNRQAVPGTPLSFLRPQPRKVLTPIACIALPANSRIRSPRPAGFPDHLWLAEYDHQIRLRRRPDHRRVRGSGTLLRKFIYGPGIDEPICLLEVAESNAVYYYHFDGLGSVVALSDVNSVLVERYTYDVFGRPTIRDANGTEIAASAFANPYLFTGRAYDAETGLYYYRARYYDYATGRFLQADPTGYADGLNLYAYVGNNPAIFSDAYGLCKEDSLWKNLWKGKYVGTGYGEFALRHYANNYVNANSLLAKYANALGMVFSSLWQEETWKYTTLTLALAYAADKACNPPPSTIPPAPPEDRPPKPAKEFRHDKPPSRPHYDPDTGKEEPDHWHETDWNWSPEKKKWFPKPRYYGPERPPDAPPDMQ